VPTIPAKVSWFISGTTVSGVAFLTVVGEQQKSAGQPLLAGVEKLIDQILLGAHVA